VTTRRRTLELIEATVIVLFGAFFYAMTWEITAPLAGVELALTPGSFPRLILGLMIVLGIVRGIIALRLPRDEAAAFPWDKVVFLTAVLSLAYAVCARYLGIFIPMPFYCVALGWLWGARSIPKLAGVAIGAPVCIWLLFDVMFRAELPVLPVFMNG
jgi:hypothetical protein